MFFFVLLCLAPQVHTKSLSELGNTATLDSQLPESEKGHKVDVIVGANSFMQDGKTNNRREGSSLMRKDTSVQEVPSAVSWDICTDCKCHATAEKGHVIRYQSSKATFRPIHFDNWYYKDASTEAMHKFTPAKEFGKGFKNDAHGTIVSRNPTYRPVDVTHLPFCGGSVAGSLDCWYEPKPCTFDSFTGNPHDAKPGEYCCSVEYGYCSYSCKDQETFHCPKSSSRNRNFVGGMDPANDVEKACFTAQYNKQAYNTPESQSVDFKATKPQ